MKANSYILPTICSLLIGGCTTSPDFDVMLIDAISHKPISGVHVTHSTMHYTGVKSSEVTKAATGKTDQQGMFNVGKLNNSARDHSISFVKKGYESMYLIARELDGKHICRVVKENSKKRNEPITITDSTVVTIPMRRN